MLYLNFVLFIIVKIRHKHNFEHFCHHLITSVSLSGHIKSKGETYSARLYERLQIRLNKMSKNVLCLHVNEPKSVCVYTWMNQKVFAFTREWTKKCLRLHRNGPLRRTVLRPTATFIHIGNKRVQSTLLTKQIESGFLSQNSRNDEYPIKCPKHSWWVVSAQQKPLL